MLAGYAHNKHIYRAHTHTHTRERRSSTFVKDQLVFAWVKVLPHNHTRPTWDWERHDGFSIVSAAVGGVGGFHLAAGKDKTAKTQLTGNSQRKTKFSNEVLVGFPAVRRILPDAR